MFVSLNMQNDLRQPGDLFFKLKWFNQFLKWFHFQHKCLQVRYFNIIMNPHGEIKPALLHLLFTIQDVLTKVNNNFPFKQKTKSIQLFDHVSV